MIWALKLETTAGRLGEIALHIGKMAMSANYKVAFAHALPFLYAMGDTIMAWMLLWRAVVASEKLAAGAQEKGYRFLRRANQNRRIFYQYRASADLRQDGGHPRRMCRCHRNFR